MATYYWVGGSGNWDATTTTNWATSSGGAGGAGVPTSADDVIFDANSNVGTGAFTVTVTGTSAASAVCRDFSTGGAGGALDGAMTLTMGATAELDCYGSMTLPATNFAFSNTAGAVIVFAATTTGKTLTTNGVSLGNGAVQFNGANGGWTLGSAYTSTSTITAVQGTFDTGNFSITASGLQTNGSATKQYTLGSSTITLSAAAALNFTQATGLTVSAGTSQINCSNASVTFGGQGNTFYNVSFTSAAGGTHTINHANTFNNLTFTSRSATGLRVVTLSANQTVNGTLTFGSANNAVQRMQIVSNVVGTQRTITLNGTLATLSDVDFRDIVAAGTVTTPWTGTRLGDGQNNNNITFDAPKTVYWNLAGAQNWSATGWATTNNGTPAVNNFPLAQDTAIFTEAGAAGTITYNAGWWVGSINMQDGVSNRTTAFTLALVAASILVYGPTFTLFSNLTLTATTGTVFFVGNGITQTFTSAGVSMGSNIFVQAPGGTVTFNDNTTTTQTLTLQNGTLDLNNKTITCNIFGSNTTNTRSIAFGTGNITVTGNSATIVSMSNMSGFSYTGTPTINCNYSGSTGTRAINCGNTAGGSETNAININISAGTDIINLVAGHYKSVNFAGFTGSMAAVANTRNIYGDLTFPFVSFVGTNLGSFTFAATSGTQLLTANPYITNFNIIVNAPGATVKLISNITHLATGNTFTLTAGTLDLNTQILRCDIFSSNNSNVRSISFGLNGWIELTGNNAVIFDMSNSTNFSYTGTATIKADYTGNVGTRTIAGGQANLGGTEANALNFYISYAVDTVKMGGLQNVYKTIDFTGFSGTFANDERIIYGDLVLPSTMTLSSGSNATTFAATSGTQTITSNGRTMDFPITVSAPGATVLFADALTMGSTQPLTFSDGTIKLASGVISTVGQFITSGTTLKYLDTSAFGRAGISQASGIVDATYLSVKNSQTYGGATFNAYLAKNNIDAGNNIGWNFNPPSTFFMLM